jgi:hypothetical protein
VRVDEGVEQSGADGARVVEPCVDAESRHEERRPMIRPATKLGVQRRRVIALAVASGGLSILLGATGCPSDPSGTGGGGGSHPVTCKLADLGDPTAPTSISSRRRKEGASSSSAYAPRT